MVFSTPGSKSLESASHIKKLGFQAKKSQKQLSSPPVQKILLAVDACQSGAILGSFETFLQRKALQEISENAGVHIITATRADQLAPEFSQLKHGLFTTPC